MFGNFNLRKKSDVLVGERILSLKINSNELYSDEEISLASKVLSFLSTNVIFILGFGRGYFAGDDYMTYLVKKDGEFYWLHHNYDKFDTVGIFKIHPTAYSVLKLLEENKMSDCIFEFDEKLYETGFYDLNNVENLDSTYYERIPKINFFGFDFDNGSLANEIFCEFQPQNYGSDYPHKSFDYYFGEKRRKKHLNSLVKEFSSSNQINFSHDGKSLFIEVNNKKFLLIED